MTNEYTRQTQTEVTAAGADDFAVLEASLERGRTAALQSIKKAAWVGLLCNIVLATAKILAGWLASSQAVLADGIHSLSDLVTDAALLIGVRFWSAPADDRHPYGHQRIEALVTTGIALVLALAALEIGYEAIVSLRTPTPNRPGLLALLAVSFSIVLKEALYRWTLFIAKKARSQALQANAWHHRTDALSSIPATIAVILSMLWPNLDFVDGLGALVVSLFILKAAWDIAKPALSELIDRGASEDIIRRIEKVALETDGVLDAHKVRTRFQGPMLFMDLHVMVAPNLSVQEGHVISGKVKTRLLELIPDTADVVIHLEPYDGY